MNIRRWLTRRGPLIMATLAITVAAAVISPASASASTTNVNCSLSVFNPRQNAGLVTADAYVFCNGLTSGINLSLDLTRDGVIVDSVLTGGSLGASALVAVACVPGSYVATAWATIWYPFGNIPGAESISWSSAIIPITCAPTPPVVAPPGNQSTFVYDSDELQMTATGGTVPYTWSATGLPAGFSINPGTGLISGASTRIATSTVTVTAVDTAGRSGSTQFTWAIRREPCPRC